MPTPPNRAENERRPPKVSPVSARRAPGALRDGLGFVAISGLGWLIDTAVTLLLVGSLAADVFIASVAGGLCGASFAFLCASRWIFSRDAQHTDVRSLGLYLLYTLALIGLGAFLIDRVDAGIRALPAVIAAAPPTTTTALAAKCLVTPLLLLSNFFMARQLNRRPPRRHSTPAP